MNILVNGPQGSGKTTQAKLLAEKFDLNFVDSGSILRESYNTELGKQAKAFTDEGKLVPDELYIQILTAVMAKECDPVKGYVFTGFPRTLSQIPLMENTLGIKLDRVIELKVGEDVFMDRIMKRAQLEQRADETPEAIKQRLTWYHERTEPVLEHYKKQGIVLEIDGEKTVEEIFVDIVNKL